MGTRADYYVKQGEDLEWLGSVAWDGYDTAPAVLAAKDAVAFRMAAAEFFASREDATLPTDDWPWPWEDSQTTDCQYVYDCDAGEVVRCAWGRLIAPDEDEEGDPAPWTWPNMADVQNVQLGSKRSGVIVITA